MKSLLKFAPDSNTAKTLIVSIMLHLFIFIIAWTLKNDIVSSNAGKKYVQISTAEIGGRIDPRKDQNIPIKKNETFTSERKLPDKDQIKLNKNSNPAVNSNFASDTAGLEQIYKESTLDVSIRYPVGWTYIDQDIKNKLDGVTFWATSGIYSPPPYIHLEVKEKYLFNPARYKYSLKTDLYTAYYNDPEELSGQVSQEVYIRTETDDDFSIKLIMEGKEDFRSFQPVFFGMIKSFKFGNSFF